MDFGVKRSKVKVTMHWLLKMINVAYYLSSYTYHHETYIIQILTTSQGCVLLISGSKGSRSRSQFIDYWKWLMSHNCFPFTPIIVKLHTKNPLEDVGVQRSRSQCSDYWKWFLLHICFILTPKIMKLQHILFMSGGRGVLYTICHVRTASF